MSPEIFIPALAALALAASGEAAAPVRAAPTPSSAPIIVALGDSLTAGRGLPRSEAFPAVLQSRIAVEGLGYHVVNAGVSGETSSQIARRFDHAVVPGTSILILEAGANDGLRGVPVETLEHNLEAMIRKAQARGIAVLLCGMETPPYRGWQYTLDFHNVFPTMAERYGVALMPFFLQGVVGLPEYNLPDRVHPNAAGARVIADNVWRYLHPLLNAEVRP